MLVLLSKYATVAGKCPYDVLFLTNFLTPRRDQSHLQTMRRWLGNAPMMFLFLTDFLTPRRPSQVRQHQGYCPQFDALNDLLTGRETLTMYCRLRGIPEAEIPLLVEWSIRKMQLDRWADRITKVGGGRGSGMGRARERLARQSELGADGPRRMEGLEGL